MSGNILLPNTLEENYSPRGIGSNYLPCYVCNEGNGALQNDMAAFVADKAAGERVVAMYDLLGLHADLDFRDFEPNWVQVKVGACTKHNVNLEKLLKLCSQEGKINPALIVQSLLV